MKPRLLLPSLPFILHSAIPARCDGNDRSDTLCSPQEHPHGRASLRYQLAGKQPIHDAAKSLIVNDLPSVVAVRQNDEA